MRQTRRNAEHHKQYPATPSQGNALGTSHAQTLAAGTREAPLVVDNNPAAFRQGNPGIVALNTHRAIGVFTDDRNGITEVYGQLIDSSGAMPGNNIQLTHSAGGRSAQQPAIARRNDGALIAWVVSNQGGVWVADVDSLLNVVSGPHRIDANDGQVVADRPAISTANGTGVVVWEDFSASDNIYGRRIATDGQPSGPRFVVNAGALSNVRWAPSVSCGAVDTFAVVWEDYRSGDGDIYFRSFIGDGTPVTGEILISEGAAGVDAYQPAISSLTTVGFLITWIDTRTGGTDLYGRVVRANGTIPSPSFPIARAADTALFWDPAVTAQSPASFVVSWASYGSQTRIMGQRLVNGAVFGNPFPFSAANQPRDRFAPAVVQFPNGINAALWVDKRSRHFDIFLGRTNALAQFDGFDQLVNDDQTGAQQLTGAVTNRVGGTYCLVYEDRWRDDGDIRLLPLNSSGLPMGDPKTVNSDSIGGRQSDPDLQIDNLGNGLVVWNDLRTVGSSETSDIRGRWYNASLTALGADFRVTDDANDAGHSCPRVSSTTSGGFVACWLDYRTGGNGAVMAQVYDANRQAIGANMTVNLPTNVPDGTPPAVMALPSGEFLIAWRSADSVGQGAIWMRPYVAGNPPTGLAPQKLVLSDPTANPRALALAPLTGDGFAMAFTAEHGTGTGVFLQYFDEFTGQVGGNIPVSQPGSTVSLKDIDCDTDDAGFLGVTWTDLDAANPQVMRQLYDPFGGPVEGNAVVHSSNTDVVHQSPILGLSGQKLLVIWEDNRNPEAGFDLFSSAYEYSTTDVFDDQDSERTLPESFAVTGNFPNPFNPATTIAMTLPSPARIEVLIYDILGRRVTSIAAGSYDAGSVQVNWDGRDADGRSAAAGVYFARLEATTSSGAVVQSRAHKMTLLK